MIESAVYPVLAIVGGGLGLYYLLEKRFTVELRPSERIHFVLIVSSFLLVVPWVFIGLQPDGILHIPILGSAVELTVDFYSYIVLIYAILLLLTLYSAYHSVELLVEKFENFDLSNYTNFFSFDKVLIIIILAEYFVLQAILPIRGFDALYYYFPESEVIYLSDSIPDINFLSFQPIVKAPLNVMLYTFTLYITNEAAYQFIPLLLISGSTFLAYDISLEFFGDENKAILSSLVFLVTPVVYWTVSYWTYYQELFIGYFFVASLYFSWKSITKSGPHVFLDLLLGTLSLSLALLSKINAWPFFVIFALALPVKKIGRYIQLTILILLTFFLIIRAITTIYAGVGLLILFLASYIGYLIITRPLPKSDLSLSRILLLYLGGLILGGFWLFDRINRSTNVLSTLNEEYFQLYSKIVWEHPNLSSFSFDQTLERMHAVNFLSGFFFFFLGIAFCLPWLLPKLFALLKGRENATISIWLLSFFMIWNTYYFHGSIRYLSPIYILMAVMTVFGFEHLLQEFHLSLKAKFPRLMLLFFGVTNFYFLIPLDFAFISDNTQELVGNAYNRSAFWYYAHPEVGIIQSLIFILIWLVVILISGGHNKTLDRLFRKAHSHDIIANGIVLLKRFQSPISKTAFILIILVPITIQGYALAINNFNIEDFHGTIEYEYNDDYQGIIEHILDLGSPTGAIMTVRMPGVNYFTRRPVIDFYYQSEVLGDVFYVSTNLTYLVEILKHPLDYLLPEEYNVTLPYEIGFEFIVVPNTKNIYHDIYIRNIEANSYFFRNLVDISFFQRVYYNDRYILYKIL